MTDPIALVPTKSDAEIAEDLKARINEAMAAALPIFDEAAAAGLTIQWDSIAPKAPSYRHAIHGLRIVKHY